MQIRIQGRNMSIPPKLESYVERKVEKLDKYLPEISEVRVDLSQHKNSKSEDQHVAQITLRHSRGTILRAEERTTDIFTAVDQGIDKIYRQIEKFKGRRSRRKQASAQEAQDFSAYETAIDLDESELESGVVIRRKQFSIAPMLEDEAIEQMELLGHDFFVFVNGENAVVNVIYRRKDGNYGLLEPQK